MDVGVEPFSRPEVWVVQARVEHDPYATPWQRGRRNINKGLRARVFDEKGRDCTYCGEPGCSVLDHMLPVTRGGKNSFENLFPACETCNTSKGNRTLIEWLVYQLERKRPLRRFR